MSLDSEITNDNVCHYNSISASEIIAIMYKMLAWNDKPYDIGIKRTEGIEHKSVPYISSIDTEVNKTISCWQ